jgi:hypothetical protein
VRVSFTRLTGNRYAVDVLRTSGPPARLRVSPRYPEPLPASLAHFVVEREFGLRLGIYGQLAAGGDAGTFWSAPAHRDSQLANRAHRLQITGRGDLGRSVALVGLCTATWELENGRREVPADGSSPIPQRLNGPLLDATQVPASSVAAAVRLFGEIAAQWSTLGVGAGIVLAWPSSLSYAGRRSA